jgi:hypothetical protein
MDEQSPKTRGILAQIFALGNSITELIRAVRGEQETSDATSQRENGEEPPTQLALPAGEMHAEAAQLLTQHTPGWNTPRPATLPIPSYAPAMTAFGILFIALGAVTKWPLSIAGACIFGVAIAKWIGELLHD